MKIRGMILIAGIFLAPSLFAQNETPLESKIESIGLFKNGLGYVKETVSVQTPGKYVISNVPEPDHGTFWIESEAEIVAKVTSRLAKVPLKDSIRTFQDLFAGRKVTVFFGKEGIPPQSLKGTICPQEILKTGGTWSHDYDTGNNYYGYYNSYRPSQPPAVDTNPLGGRFLKVKTDTGTTYLDSSLIAYIESDGENETTEMLKPVLVLDVKKITSAPAVISISYLTRGIAWAPSYKIELTGTDALKITQKAIVKNEFAKFSDTELNLISGFPNVKFAYVTSPLSPRTNWASFFQQLNRRTYGGDHQIMSNVVSQQAISRGPSGNDDLDFSPEGDTADIHYNSIGRFTMEEGDAIALDVASEKASYEELVEWIIPNTRTPDGRQIQEYEIHQNPEKYEQATWDAMKFKNPFKFPMTTASAMISSSGKFLGETVSTWVNPGQETVLQITKALSISTNATECEVEGKREIVSLGGHNFRKGLAEGVLTVKNHRKKNVSLQVEKCFSGNLKSAEENPKCELRGEGIYSVNKSNELIWDLELKPGEEKTLKYQYEVLVSN